MITIQERDKLLTMIQMYVVENERLAKNEALGHKGQQDVPRVAADELKAFIDELTEKRDFGRDLMRDEDGENRALRSFLLQWGLPGLTVDNMKRHMEMSGWQNMWPKWVDVVHPKEHLTKAGAQLWIRHILSLEPK